MAHSPSQVKLVPYTIDSIVDKTNETLKGVSLIQAPAIWE
jgi:major intracellular serine protease